MRVQKIQNNNTSFGAGEIRLNRISAGELLQYDAIKRIAEEDKLDLSIVKSEESKYLPKENMYTVIAKQYINRVIPGVGELEFPAHGTSCLIVDKKTPDKEVAGKLYETVIKSVETLAENIKKYTGKKPEFLKYLKNI